MAKRTSRVAMMPGMIPPPIPAAQKNGKQDQHYFCQLMVIDKHTKALDPSFFHDAVGKIVDDEKRHESEQRKVNGK
eukprot:11940368-Ditylum_brightwellii.AAC.1